MRRQEVFVNRELRWLSFNERVLLAAENPHTPLMERLKFIGIFSSNLDEFYSVRVGSLNRMILDPANHPAPPGIKPKKLIRDILKRVQDLSDRVDAVFTTVMRECRQNSIFIVDDHTISILQKQFVDSYFTSHVRNRLFPILLDPELPMPYLKHVSIYLAVDMYSRGSDKPHRYAIIEVPTDMLPRYIRIPSKNNKDYFIILEDVIRLHLGEIFNTLDYDSYKAYTIKITRDAEYDLAEMVTKSLYEKLSSSIRQRKMGVPVRVVYDRDMPSELFEYLREHADFTDCDNIMVGGRYHNARDMISFPKIRRKELYYRAQPPVDHPELSLERSLIEQILAKDYMLHLPYQRYDYVIDLLREAALDPYVKSIKITLYRVAEDSSVINALRNAARNGKKITIFIELQARFDEKHNMYWTEKLSREPNITLLGGVEGFKIHSKICVISRYIGKERRRIALIGTGNYNESTARLYTDHILMTADHSLTSEANRVFKLLSNTFYEPKFKSLIVSPFYTRKQLVKLIKNEIANARRGKPAKIILKINNLVDEKMIRHLIKAAQEKVEIILLIRGIFSMTTTLDDSAHHKIVAKAMIDRYLEHTRIFSFENDGDPVVLIGSADMMVRNLDNRVEVLTPIYDQGVKEELFTYLQYHIDDTYSSYSLNSETFNTPLHTGEEGEVRAQHDLYEMFARLSKQKSGGA